MPAGNIGAYRGHYTVLQHIMGVPVFPVNDGLLTHRFEQYVAALWTPYQNALLDHFPFARFFLDRQAAE